MAVCETVKVQDGDDFKVINVEDFDEKTMKIVREKSREGTGADGGANAGGVKTEGKTKRNRK